MIKGVIFDFNGTLFFDTEKHEKAWGRYAEQILGRQLTKEENNSIMGRNNKLILKFLLGRLPSEEEERRMGGEKEEMYRQMCREEGNCRLAPGAEAFLDELKAKNVPMAIATSSDLGNVNFYYETFHIEKWFDRERVIYDDGTINGKPSPDIYLKAAKSLNLKPSECAVYEDASSGIAAARNAEAGKIIAVASANLPEILGKEEGVDRVICDYKSETFELLNKE